MKKDAKTTLAEELRAGRPVVTGTKGVSMEPLLYENKTHVVIQPLWRDPVKGDLVIYLRPDGVYVIHRIVGRRGDFFLIRGDNCVSHEKVPEDWIVGVVTQIYRKGRVISVTDWGYRLYVWFWMKSWPFRYLWYRSHIF